MGDAYLGEIRMISFGRTPRGWLPCDGKMLQVSQYTALFALLGTYYGGDGRTTFALPDLRGRVPLSFGRSAAQTIYQLGQMGGSENVALDQNTMPAHNHQATVSNDATHARASPVSGVYSSNNVAFPVFSAPGNYQALSPQMVLASGEGQGHENMQPFQVVNFIICAAGIFPPRG